MVGKLYSSMFLGGGGWEWAKAKGKREIKNPKRRGQNKIQDSFGTGSRV